jgi:hypothetical protein
MIEMPNLCKSRGAVYPESGGKGVSGEVKIECQYTIGIY